MSQKNKLAQLNKRVDAIERSQSSTALPTDVVVSATHVSQSTLSYSGPIPHPDMLAAYKDTQADFPERIFAMAEREQAHRHNCEKTALAQDGRADTLGRVFALVGVVLYVAAAMFAFYLGHPAAGGSVLGVGLAGLVSAFVLGRRARLPEKDE